MFTQRGKTGDCKGVKNTKSRNPKETLTTSHAINVEEKVNMRGGMSALHRKTQRVYRNIQKNLAKKYGNRPPDGVEQKPLVNIKDASYILIFGIPSEKWYDLPFPGLLFCQTSSQEVFHTNPITDEIKEPLSHNKRTSDVILHQSISLNE